MMEKLLGKKWFSRDNLLLLVLLGVQQGENGGTEVTPTRPSLPADSGGKE